MKLESENLYYIGGAVRDELLNVQSYDTDFCYEGNAIAFAQENCLDIIKTNPDFGTVRVSIEGKEVDIASTRTETYPRKGHLPKIVKIGCSLKEDVKRRDFTINTMAKRTTDNKLYDYYDGLSDIKNKKLRILHENSFIDDPTRIIRGLKFSVRFGFELDSDTKSLQDDYLKNINYDITYHRVKKELVETFNLNKSEAYNKFLKQGIYKLLGNKFKPLYDINGEDIQLSINKTVTKYTWLIYLAPILLSSDITDIPIPLTRTEKRILEWAVKLKTHKVTNNTPDESIIIRELIDNAK